MTKTSYAFRRLMTIPGVGHLTTLAFTAAVDDPECFKCSRDIGADFGLVPRRYQSGEIDYTGSISKCGDKRVRTLLYEAANVLRVKRHPNMTPSSCSAFNGFPCRSASGPAR
jgi:transposase